MAEKTRESLVMNKSIFNFLKNFGWTQIPKNRYVTLVFDMISIRNVIPTTSKMENLPTHVLLFTVKVINRKGFQPIGNVFLYENTPAWKLSDCIKAYILDLERCQLFVIATVCPPTVYFRSVVENLVEMSTLQNKTDAHIYNVGNINNIIHVYDAPSMLREVRNHFVKCPVTFNQFGAECCGNYEDVKRILKMTTNESLKSILEMKGNEEVNKYAIKLFSMSMSRELQRATNHDKTRYRGTANLCSFFDVLFDSFNGDTDYDNLNRRPLNSFSLHNKIWRDAIPVLKSMKFSAEAALEEREQENPSLQQKQAFSDDVIDVSLISEAKRKQKKIKSSDQKVREEHSDFSQAQICENCGLDENVFQKKTVQPQNSDEKESRFEQDEQRKTKVTNQHIQKEQADDSNITEKFKKGKQKKTDQHFSPEHSKDYNYVRKKKKTEATIQPRNSDDHLKEKLCIKLDEQKKIKETTQHIGTEHSDYNQHITQKKKKKPIQHIQPRNSDDDHLQEKLSIKLDEQKKIKETILHIDTEHSDYNQHFQGENADENNLTGNIPPCVKQDKQNKTKATEEENVFHKKTVQPQNSDERKSRFEQDEQKKLQVTNQHIRTGQADDSNFTENITQGEQKKTEENDQQFGAELSDPNQAQNSEDFAYVKKNRQKKIEATIQHIQPQNSSCIKQDEQKKIKETTQHVCTDYNQHITQKKMKETIQHIQPRNSDDDHLQEKLCIKLDEQKKIKETIHHIDTEHSDYNQHIQGENADENNLTGNITPCVKQDKQKKAKATEDKNVFQKKTVQPQNSDERSSRFEQDEQKTIHVTNQHIRTGQADDSNSTENIRQGEQKNIEENDQQFGAGHSDPNQAQNSEDFDYVKKNRQKKIEATIQHIQPQNSSCIKQDEQKKIKETTQHVCTDYNQHITQKKMKQTAQHIQPQHFNDGNLKEKRSSCIKQDEQKKIKEPTQQIDTEHPDHNQHITQEKMKETIQHIQPLNSDDGNLKEKLSSCIKQDEQKKIKETTRHIDTEHADYNQHITEEKMKETIQPQNSDDENEKNSFVKQEEEKRIKATNQRGHADDNSLTKNISPQIKQGEQKKIKETNQHIDTETSDSNQHTQARNSEDCNIFPYEKKNKQKKIKATIQHDGSIKQDKQKEIKANIQHIQPQNSNDDNLKEKLYSCIKQDEQKKIKETTQHIDTEHPDRNQHITQEKMKETIQHIQPQNSNDDNLKEKLSSCIKQDEQKKIKETTQHIDTEHADYNQHITEEKMKETIQPQNSDDENEKNSFVKQEEEKRIKATNQRGLADDNSLTKNISPQIKQGEQKKIKETNQYNDTETSDSNQHIQTQNSEDCNIFPCKKKSKQKKVKATIQHDGSLKQDKQKESKANIQHIQPQNSDDANLNEKKSFVKQEEEKKIKATNQSGHADDNSLTKNISPQIKHGKQKKTKATNQHIQEENSNSIQHIQTKNSDDHSLTCIKLEKQKKTQVTNQRGKKSISLHVKQDTQTETKTTDRVENSDDTNLKVSPQIKKEKAKEMKALKEFELGNLNKRNKQRKLNRKKQPLQEKLDDRKSDDVQECNHSSDVFSEHSYANSMLEALNDTQYLDMVMKDIDEDINSAILTYENLKKSPKAIIDKYKNYRKKLMIVLNQSANLKSEADPNDSNAANSEARLSDDTSTNGPDLNNGDTHTLSCESLGANGRENKEWFVSSNVNFERRKDCDNKAISKENEDADSNDAKRLKESENPNAVCGRGTLKNCDWLHENLLIKNFQEKNERKVNASLSLPKIISQLVEKLKQRGMWDASCCSDEISRDGSNSETNTTNPNCVNKNKKLKHSTCTSNEHKVVDDKENEGTHIHSKSMMKEAKRNNLRDDEQYMDVMEEASDIAANDDGDALNEMQNVQRPYVLDAWVISINGMKEIYKTLQQKHFQNINTREFNVDCVRYMLHRVKQSHGVCQPYPVEEEDYQVLDKDLVECAFLAEASLTLA